MRDLDTQTAQQTQVYPYSSSAKVMRNYQVVLKCVDQSQREEINQRIRALEERQFSLLTHNVVKKAVELYKSNSKEKFFIRKLGKAVGMNPNIAESAFH